MQCKVKCLQSTLSGVDGRLTEYESTYSMSLEKSITEEKNGSIT